MRLSVVMSLLRVDVVEGSSSMSESFNHSRCSRFTMRVDRQRLVTMSPLSNPAKVPSRRASGRQARSASRALA